MADQLQRALAAPFDLSGHRVTVSASIGIVLGATDQGQAGDILRDADTAMYCAKTSGKGRYAVFQPAMRDRAVARLELEDDLKRAVERQEFRVYYQPIWRLQDNQLTGFEALVRWEHPTRGILQPAAFLAVAEEIGLILPISIWVLREACRQMRDWQAALEGSRALTISVNVSSAYLMQPDFAQQVGRILQETGLPAPSLVLELTERVIVENIQSVAHVLEQLHAVGVRVQIDDFGTGYSSLSYLQHLPAETLQIDRSFIRRMEESRDGAELIRAVIALGRALGMKVIAEGIETTGQLDMLKELDCTYGQGFLFAKPADSQAVEDLLKGLSTSASQLPQGSNLEPLLSPSR